MSTRICAPRRLPASCGGTQADPSCVGREGVLRRKRANRHELVVGEDGPEGARQRERILAPYLNPTSTEYLACAPEVYEVDMRFVGAETEFLRTEYDHLSSAIQVRQVLDEELNRFTTGHVFQYVTEQQGRELPEKALAHRVQLIRSERLHAEAACLRDRDCIGVDADRAGRKNAKISSDTATNIESRPGTPSTEMGVVRGLDAKNALPPLALECGQSGDVFRFVHCHSVPGDRPEV